MKFKMIGSIKIPVLGLGTSGIGGFKEKDTTYDKKNIFVIKEAIKLGITHIDTAEIYAGGHTEELIGEAIKGFERKNLFITTKVSPENLKYNDVISSAKQSLKRLKTKYIDLYLIHYPNPNIPIKKTMKAMDYLVKENLTRFIGVSNFSVDQLKEAHKYTENKILANQVEYNLLARNNGKLTSNVESEVIPYCQNNNVIVIAYSPLAFGKLTKPGFDVLDQITEKYNKTQAQVSLNWLISKKGIITIPKSANVEHVKENLGAVGWRLKQEDVRKLDLEFNQGSFNRD